MNEHPYTLSGMILDETTTFSLDELRGVCRAETATIVALVEEGITEPLASAESEWRFTASQLPRAQAAMRLQQELELNLAGVALALELLEEIETLRARLRQLESPF